MSCNAHLMRRAYYAGKSGDWEGCKDAHRNKGQISEWAFNKVKESNCKVASEDIGRLSIAQDILRKSTDLLRRIIAPASGVGGAILSHVCPHCDCFSLEDYIWWMSSGHGDGNNRKKKQCSWWCAACGGQRDWRAPNRLLVIQDSVDLREAKSLSNACCAARTL